MTNIKENYLNAFKNEIKALEYVMSKTDNSITDVVNLIKNISGKVVISGIGKSGIIGKKIAATFTSVGLPSTFIHSTDAIHGDMGIISNEDVLIAISYSGETSEVLDLLGYLDSKIPIIAITGNVKSNLAKKADFTIDIDVETEACPLNLAPTNSTTATLVVGDALAISFMYESQVCDDDYAKFHPGGRLGRRLLRLVRDEMIKENLPITKCGVKLLDIIPMMSKGKLGMILLINDDQRVVGVFTDGDLRRTMQSRNNFLDKYIEDLVTLTPIKVKPDMKIVDAEKIMEQNKISFVIVEDERGLQGVLQIYNT